MTARKHTFCAESLSSSTTVYNRNGGLKSYVLLHQKHHVAFRGGHSQHAEYQQAQRHEHAHSHVAANTWSVTCVLGLASSQRVQDLGPAPACTA